MEEKLIPLEVCRNSPTSISMRSPCCKDELFLLLRLKPPVQSPGKLERTWSLSLYNSLFHFLFFLSPFSFSYGSPLIVFSNEETSSPFPTCHMPHAFFLIFLYFFIPPLYIFAPKKIRPNLVLYPFYFNFPLITIRSSNYILFAPYLWYFYNNIFSSYIMTFVSCFDKLQIYPCLFSGFSVLFPENSYLNLYYTINML